MKTLRTEPEASIELAEAAVRYEGKREGLGIEFLEAVDAALDFVTRFTHAGSPVPLVPKDLPVRRAPVRRFPFHGSTWKFPMRFESSHSLTIAVDPVTGSTEFDVASVDQPNGSTLNREGRESQPTSRNPSRAARRLQRFVGPLRVDVLQPNPKTSLQG
jgi:hypothetical protein